MNCKMNKWKIDTPRDEVCNKYSSLSGFVRLTNSHEPYRGDAVRAHVTMPPCINQGGTAALLLQGKHSWGV